MRLAERPETNRARLRVPRRAGDTDRPVDGGCTRAEGFLHEAVVSEGRHATEHEIDVAVGLEVVDAGGRVLELGGVPQFQVVAGGLGDRPLVEEGGAVDADRGSI